MSRRWFTLSLQSDFLCAQSPAGVPRRTHSSSKTSQRARIWVASPTARRPDEVHRVPGATSLQCGSEPLGAACVDCGARIVTVTVTVSVHGDGAVGEDAEGEGEDACGCGWAATTTFDSGDNDDNTTSTASRAEKYFISFSSFWKVYMYNSNHDRSGILRFCYAHACTAES